MEALVFSHRAADEINRLMKSTGGPIKSAVFPEDENTLPLPSGIRTETRAIMQRAYFVVPNQQEIVKGYERIAELKKMLEQTPYRVDRNYVEALSLVTVAYIILKELL